MTKPVTIPNTFATATTAIPLSNLDADFSTVATALNDANTYSNYAPDTGSANAYVVTLSGVSTTYSAGLRIQFKAGNANTTASTLNVNGGGAKNITYQDATAIASGTIAANSIVDVMYDGTQFLLMNDPAGATGGDVVGPSSATDNAIVRFDGTTGKLVQNSVVTIADSTGDISGVGQLNATTVDATNIEVTNIKAKDGTAAGSIADSTGVVSFTANPVMSGGTANGVLYLNGSKVATSGSALTFDGTKLTIGTATAAGALTVVAPASTAYGAFDAPTAGFAFHDYKYNGTRYGLIGQGSALYVSGSNTDFGVLASNALVFGASGTEGMRLTSTGLGIGTSSPLVSAAGRGNITVNGSTDAILAFGSAGSNTGYLYGTTSGMELASIGSTYVRFSTNGSERMRLDSSGNLGLGVTPSAWDSTTALQVGSVGGAVSSASTQISLSYNWVATATGNKYINNGFASIYQQNAGTHAWYNAPSGTAGNTITLTQALTLDASGNLLLGGTSAGASSAASLAIFNGTAPTGSVTNGIILYAEDVSSSSELKVRDEAGNVTTLSPHNFSLIPDGPSEDMAWAYYSEKGGKRINVDMLKLARMVEKLTGEKLVYES